MATNIPLLRPLAIAAGALGCVIINNNVIFTYVKHLEISNVKVANPVKYIFSCFTAFLFISLSLISLRTI
jgi:hypothetical protein